MSAPNIYDLFDKSRRPSRERPAETPAPTADTSHLHPYAAAVVAAELDRLDRLPRPWSPNSYWDQTTFEVACNLLEIANSPWSGYSPTRAQTDLMRHAPADEQWGRREHHAKWSSALERVGTGARPEPTPGETAPATTVITTPDVDPDVEADFWDARPLLRHVHDFARARRASPWAVLGVVLARIATATPHQVCLPPIVGGKGSLNMFVGLVGRSGAGKGAATGTGADAVHIAGVKTARLASGEAIAHLFKRRLSKAERDAGESDWVDDSHARLVDVSEIDRFAAQSNRQGSTLMADLRAAWSGEMLGQVAADSTRSFLVEAHQYRLTMLVGIQPHRAGVLLDDEDGGTPQRFVWLPVTDPDAPARRPACPEPITWAPPPLRGIIGIGGAPMVVDQVIVDEIDASRLATLRGETDPLDGHKKQSQLKLAAVLALADGRTDVGAEDWSLAQVVMWKSDSTRAAVVSAMTTKAAEEGRRAAEGAATRAVIVEERTADAATKRACNAILARLRRAGDWVPHAELRRALSAPARTHFEEAVARLSETGQVEHDPQATRDGGGRSGAGAYRLTEGGAS